MIDDRAVDPATTPGDLKTALLDRCRELKVGGKVAMADGTTLKAVKGKGRSERWFMAQGHGINDVKTSHHADEAVQAALDYSARNKHSKAIGGAKTYPDFDSFVNRNS